MENLKHYDRFVNRHIGISQDDLNEMLQVMNVNSIDDLMEEAIPKGIRLTEGFEVCDPLSEYEMLDYLRDVASKNKLFDSYIGLGYNPTITPAAIQRNVFENPGWYTQYTPYQAEISQGRLEALLNFQTMVCDLTGLPLANASLLDEGTAAAEAMLMFYSLRKKEKQNSLKFFVEENVFPQTIDVLKTRAKPFGIELIIDSYSNVKLSGDFFGLLVQYPDKYGQINQYQDIIAQAKENNIFTCFAADIMSLVLLISPGELGVDCAVGSTQRFGVPMGYGGPHAGYFATKDEFKRNIPGRIIGVSIDTNERPALRMALQTREQHIKREKATSNICTAQVLLAIMASMYAVYHGPKGLRKIADSIHYKAIYLAERLRVSGYDQINTKYFDTLRFKVNENDITKLKELSEKWKMNFGYQNNYVTISLNEVTTEKNLDEIVEVFAELNGTKNNLSTKINLASPIADDYLRSDEILTHPVFNSYHSETELMRYIKSLENKDLSLTRSMIPLGSCTMKLNAATELLPVSWSKFARIHPFVPNEQTSGYEFLVKDFEKILCKITGFSAISFQPNSGAQGEYAGLMVIRRYQEDIGQENRNVVLIPSSAHGTNPASAVMSGGKVVVVKCDDHGNIDVNDLKEKAETNKENLSALMITYPSTHGVFEEEIKEICKIVHDNGGQVYMDGANMNAQIGYTNPHEIGADVCHLNLHKTFAIPHGGGGPGVGPIGVAEHLVQYLPTHSMIEIGTNKSMTAVSSAPFGSASILPISYAYCRMMGTEGLKRATEFAILNANYIKSRLEKEFKVLYSGSKNRVAHELIFDMREFKQSANIEVEDIAKRLMDYGFHAPTVSFPVPGTLMVEPTESESKAELDRFCEAMTSIKREIEKIASGEFDKEDNPIKNSPHTAEDVTSDNWQHKYSREEAAFPLEWLKQNKFWPAVSRVNNAYGDRNLVCSCLPISEYES
ncbi:MAG: aminomethyl-transferring glycine dehydrogenase [Melioribacteraceae bacterium]|nr:aminomethyl-transferring glycine dehydrogenase [Melioribacteraceae bacterium]MDD3557954.1 aminomethyl-transferring glycine dehydrogenase [Melioribacteraceae bacterium]